MSRHRVQPSLFETTSVYDNAGAPAPLPIVGHSKRSPGKHEFLDALLKIQCGVISVTPCFRSRPLILHDLTAGDGKPKGGAWHRTCSPGIFARHVKWCAQNGVQATAYLSERDPKIWEELRENLKHNLIDDGWSIRRGWRTDTRLVADFVGSKVGVIEAGLRQTPARSEAVGTGEIGFVFHDPNHVYQADFPAAFLPTTQDLVMSLLTMSYNAGGIKRMPWEERRHWNGRIAAVRSRLHRHQDLMLTRLVNDASQWTYLAVVPVKWRARVHRAAAKAFREAGWGIDVHWLRDDSAAFDEVCKRLVMTKKEIGL